MASLCREWGNPSPSIWNVDEDCCAGLMQMGCADGFSPEVQLDSICYEDSCTTGYKYSCVDVEDPSFVTTDEPGVDYTVCLKWTLIVAGVAFLMQCTSMGFTLLANAVKTTSWILKTRLLFAWFVPGIMGWAVFFNVMGACCDGYAGISLPASIVILLVSAFNSPIGRIVWGLNPLPLPNDAIRFKLTLDGNNGEGERGLKNNCVSKFGGHGVEKAQICPKHEAIEALWHPVAVAESNTKAGFIRISSDKNYAFDCRDGKYHDANDVFIYWNHRGTNQLFVNYGDGTVGPYAARNMRLGEKGTLCLVHAGSDRVLRFTHNMFPGHVQPRTTATSMAAVVGSEPLLPPPVADVTPVIQVPLGHAKILPINNSPNFCSECGNRLEANARFCSKCGKQIHSSS